MPSPRASSKDPSLVPAALVVPRVLKRSTARSASAGRRQAILRSTWLSIMPPCVGSGCTVTIVPTGGGLDRQRELPHQRQAVRGAQVQGLPARGQHRVRDDGVGHGQRPVRGPRRSRAAQQGVCQCRRRSSPAGSSAG